MSYAKLMQIIQNSKFIIIKTKPIQTSPFTNYIGYKAHKYHKSTKNRILISLFQIIYLFLQ